MAKLWRWFLTPDFIHQLCHVKGRFWNWKNYPTTLANFRQLLPSASCLTFFNKNVDSKSFYEPLATFEVLSSLPQFFFLDKFEIDINSTLNASSVQFNSVTQSCPTLCDPVNCSMPGLPVHCQLLELAQTHVSDAIQPFHPLSFLSSPALNLSQHQGLFKWVSSSHQVTKGLEFQLQHQSSQWIFRTAFL